MMASMRVTTFTNTFLVSNNGTGGPILKVVGPQETRKKRPHRKSRLGCIRCKRRKVKCDEGDPCRNCIKRKEPCVRLSPPSPSRGGRESPPLTSPPSESAWCPFEAECGPINLLHMELLHHFERYSASTLPFQEVWPKMLQLAFQSRQHTYLINAMLSFAAAHLDYLHPGGHPQYHRAKYALLNKALHDYRESLSAPITTDNCDALFSTAYLIQFLMWCDLSFMEGQGDSSTNAPLDLSGDRLYFLSTGVRQIFFMAWPLFQSPQSVFRHVAVLQPCMALEDAVEARGLNWQRHVRALMELYENPRYQGGRDMGRGAGAAFRFSAPPQPASHYSSEGSPWPISPPASAPTSTPGPADPSTPSTSPVPGRCANGAGNIPGAAYFESLRPNLASTAAPPYRVMTLWQSYKEGEAYVENAGAHDEVLMRATFRRLAARLAVAMAFVADTSKEEEEEEEGRSSGGCPVSAGRRRQPEVKKGDMVRYVLTYAMMCFGPLLGLISSGDSRMLVVLFHIYRVVGALLPEEKYWWCRRRVEVMEEAIGRELRIRGLEVCLRRQNEVV